MTATLRLSTEAMTVLIGHLQGVWPDEGCGLLIGTGGEESRQVVRAVPAENLAVDRRREFFLDPAVLARALARWGLESVVGCFHSHPHGGVSPSARDAVGAWPSWSYLVVALPGRDARPRLASFRRRRDVWLPESVEVG